LDTVEYHVAFEQPTTAVGEPVAGHVRLLCRLAHALDVARKDLTSYLKAMDGLYRHGERMDATALTRKSSTSCRFCRARDSLVVANYIRVCVECGFENDSCRIRDDAEHLPAYKPELHHHAPCMPDERATAPDRVRKHIRFLRDQGFLTVEQEGRAAVLAVLYAAAHRTSQKKEEAPIAAAGAAYALLETWADDMVEVRVLSAGSWTSEYVSGARPTTTNDKKKQHGV
jgi:hypothetical protein